MNTHNDKLGMTDAEYTAAVDNGVYTEFGIDRAGYGLCQWTHPAGRCSKQKKDRAAIVQSCYNKYAQKGSDSPMGFTNSPLATVTMISPNRTSNRNHTIDTITIPCFVGQVTAKRGCEVFQPSSKKASCNYVVGYDSSIGLCMEEKDRSWRTGGYNNTNHSQNTLK